MLNKLPKGLIQVVESLMSKNLDETGLRKAAYAAHKSGKTHFVFQGKKYPVKIKGENLDMESIMKEGVDEIDIEMKSDSTDLDEEKKSKDVKEPTGKLKDACWSGYTAVGMKMKNGKQVPNCVPQKNEENIKEYYPGLPNIDPYKSGPEPEAPKTKPLKKEMLGKLANSYKPKLSELKKQPDDGYANSGITREQDDANEPVSTKGQNLGPKLKVKRAYASDFKYTKPIYDPKSKTWKLEKRRAKAPTISYTGQKKQDKMDLIYNLPSDDQTAQNNQMMKTEDNKKEISKSARIIKDIYKRNRYSEELVDRDKIKKSYDPKEKTSAEKTLRGGKTLTGQMRDDIEFNPEVNKTDSSNDDPRKK